MIFSSPQKRALFLGLVLALVRFNSLWAVNDGQYWAGNQIGNLFSNNGSITWGRPGVEWPLGSGKYVLYAGGLWIASEMINGSADIRSAACEFTTEYEPGPWSSDPDEPVNRIYQIREADGPANPDWLVWPVDQGAPWIDVDGDGEYNPDIDEPDVKGDLYFWTVFNDGVADQHASLWNTEPLDIEVSNAIYGFTSPSPLENVLFIEWNIHNTGSLNINSAYLGVWSDIDLRAANDEYPGSYPDLDLGYQYNATIRGVDPPGDNSPAAGFVLLQGPIIPSAGDTALVSGEPILDHANLPMTGFVPSARDLSTLVDPETAEEALNVMQGLYPNGDAVTNPQTGEPDPLLFNGNPVNGSGWLASDSFMRNDWRSVLGCGPFSLEPGETQQVVAAFVISQGYNSLASLAVLWDDVETVHEVFLDQFGSLSDLLQINEVDLPHNTESSGPFTFQFEISDPQNEWWNEIYIDCFAQSSSFHGSLSPLNEGLWEASIPAFDVNSTTTLFYYLSHDDGSGVLSYWPSGAPTNMNTMIFGPDTTPPVLAGLHPQNDVHYLLRFEKTVQIDTVYDDRFGISDIRLNWTIGNDDTMTAPMFGVDTNEVEGLHNIVYSGILADRAVQLGDTITYWVAAQDSSNANNLTHSAPMFFRAGNQEFLGAWDRITSYSEISEWNPFHNGLLIQMVPWDNVLNLVMTNEAAETDTMSMTRQLDLTSFEAGWVNVPMAFNFVHPEGYGLVQFFDDHTWRTIDSLYGLQMPDTLSYSLDAFLNAEAFRMRFLANRGGGSVNWIIDDIYIHTDPNLVGTIDGPAFPKEFSLVQNYPNPFNPVTRIRFAVPIETHVNIDIYDLKGRSVCSLLDSHKEPGYYEILWDGTNGAGTQVSTGVYFCRLKAGDYRKTIKMVKVK